MMLDTTASLTYVQSDLPERFFHTILLLNEYRLKNLKIKSKTEHSFSLSGRCLRAKPNVFYEWYGLIRPHHDLNLYEV